MKEYVRTSLETHLFFGRIMKEHALFLLAGFPAVETAYRKKADWFRVQFEKMLESTVRLANCIADEAVLCSGEVVTEFTEMAERQTRRLTGIPINIQITQAEKKLQVGFKGTPDRWMVQQVKNLNQRMLWLLNGLVTFKEKILHEVTTCSLYTANYPLMIAHILREAKLYRQILTELEQTGCMPEENRKETESFWNHIMMEHAQFIRGLLDPSECELMEKANNFADEYCNLLEAEKEQDCRELEELTGKALEVTEQYRDFKAAGAEGIIDCNIRSLILPLLADHVLREANHYLRLLKKTEKKEAYLE